MVTMIKTASDSSAKLSQKLKPYVYIVLLQFGYAGMYVITASTLKNGMNHYVLVVYRNLVAVAVMAPFALWFERPVLDQNFYYVGAKLTNASFSAAFYNILPGITFMLAITLRMEKINIRRRHSQAKVIGTTITVVGAILMILYEGPIVTFFWSKGRAHHNAVTAGVSQGGTTNWLKGTSMLFASCICWSLFCIGQSNTMESYPSKLTLTTLICGFGTLLSATVALVMERGSIKPWIIGFDIRLFTVVSSGIVLSGLAYYVQGIVLQDRGPVFVTAFNPLCMIITTLLGSIILAEEITLGRILGAAIIVIGLYSLIWGKSNDHLASSSNNDRMNGVTKLPVATRTGFVEGPTLIEIQKNNKNP